MSYHSPLAAEGSCPDKVRTGVLVEVEAFGGEVDLAAAAAAAADLARAGPGQGCLAQEDLP